jgi:hypothetical protein
MQGRAKLPARGGGAAEEALMQDEAAATPRRLDEQFDMEMPAGAPAYLPRSADGTCCAAVAPDMRCSAP